MCILVNILQYVNENSMYTFVCIHGCGCVGWHGSPSPCTHAAMSALLASLVCLFIVNLCVHVCVCVCVCVRGEVIYEDFYWSTPDN